MKKYITSFALLIMLTMSGCDDNNKTLSEYEKAVQYCMEENGTIVKSDTGDATFCQHSIAYDYDDGVENYRVRCELNDFYNGICEQIENEEDVGAPIFSSLPEHSMTVRDAMHSQVLQVLKKLDNTGYVHHSKEEGPFVLLPNYTELLKKDNENHIVPNHDIDSYNLFLDCSGFVGYYILQGIAKHLYSEVGRCYHTEGHNPPSRPLAADFADTFAKAKHVGDADVKEATLMDLENNASSVIWGRVMHIKDAKPGDIIVYKHTENITHNGKCNNITHGNTGHILFIMETPTKSTKYVKDNEWLVRVADSTTAPHSHDSRFSNTNKGTITKHHNIINKSQYKSNVYTAWTLRYKKDDVYWNGLIPHKYKSDDWMEQCDTEDKNIFHRRCESFNEDTLQKILVQTSHKQSSTGIGIGYIYISNDMKHYRVKNNTTLKKAEVYIGRPVTLIRLKN